MVSTMVFFVLGGLAALLVRTQLALPESPPFQPELYNQIFTMHATVMIFLFIIPFGVGGLGNYFVPLMIGARDMAFPRLNALSYWIFLGSGIFMYSSFVLGGPPTIVFTSPANGSTVPAGHLDVTALAHKSVPIADHLGDDELR